MHFEHQLPCGHSASDYYDGGVAGTQSVQLRVVVNIRGMQDWNCAITG
ncbi:hypothetical protein [Lysobacter gummosus]